MSLSHLYQDFSSPKAAQKTEVAGESINNERLEDEKLESFETGYKAGWDDATKAQADIHGHVSAEFARNLQEASFSYIEARSALLREMQSVLEPVLENVLPEIVRTSLPGLVVEQIRELSRDALDRPVEIAVPPENLETLEKISEHLLDDPFRIVSDGSLHADQVFVRVGAAEREIDLAKWLEDVRQMIAEHFQAAEGTPENE